jgi:uncharacterized protein (TIGR03790 family)
LTVWKIVFLAALAWLSCASVCLARGLTAADLAVIYNSDDEASIEVARFYAAARGIPAANLLGVHMDDLDVLTPAQFAPLREDLLTRLPTSVQSLLLVWTRPFAVGCMSITTAFAAGYRAAFCEPGCGSTASNPLYDQDGWLPADTVGWWPAMLLPSGDVHLAHELIRRGIAADSSRPPGTLYLVRTQDRARNVRAAYYDGAIATAAGRLRVAELIAPVEQDVPGIIGYFTGASFVQELTRLHFRPGAVADHLTSTGGILDGRDQMSVLAWLRQGATGSYGTISEPCNHVEKFPDPKVLFDHYLRGETLLEAYWKSVAMPGQGLFVGEPLARPFL